MRLVWWFNHDYSNKGRFYNGRSSPSISAYLLRYLFLQEERQNNSGNAENEHDVDGKSKEVCEQLLPLTTAQQTKGNQKPVPLKCLKGLGNTGALPKLLTNRRF